MRITGVIWLRNVVEKLEQKHDVSTAEVEDVLSLRPGFRRIEAGNVHGEDLYAALGHTGGGRYLIVFFVRKPGDRALIVSARDMTSNERRAYGRR